MTKGQKYLEICRKNIDDSTSHGFPNIFKPEQILSIRILWIISTFIAISFAVSLIVQSFIEYFKFDVTTKVRQISDIYPQYPSLTVCNFNYYTTDFTRKYDNFSIIPPSSTGKLIMDCKINSLSCNDDLVNFYHQNYGNCYTINSKIDNDYNNKEIKEDISYFNSNLYSETNGINILIDTEVYDHYSYSNPKHRGVVAYIHNPGFSPLTVQQLLIPSGFYAQIGIEKIIYKKALAPHSNCEIENVLEPDNYDSIYYKGILSLNINYTQDICVQYCKNNITFEACGCIEHRNVYLPLKKICKYGLNGQDDTQCMRNYLNLDKYCHEKCPKECETQTYSRTFSMIRNVDPNEQNYTRIRVFTQSFSFNYYEESAVNTPVNFLSNLGGILGLFIGISVLSFVELFDCLIKIFHQIYKDRPTKTRVENVEESKEQKTNEKKAEVRTKEVVDNESKVPTINDKKTENRTKETVANESKRSSENLKSAK